MFDKEFDITKPVSLENSTINDKDIICITNKLKSLKNSDFAIQQLFENVEKSLTPDEKEYLKQAKLFYVLQYHKLFFLILGLILESKLGSYVDLYLKDQLSLPANTTKSIFSEFKNTLTLYQKADKIIEINMFGDGTLSNKISAEIKCITPLRNFGGHHKTSELFEKIIVDNCEQINTEVSHWASLVTIINNTVESYKS